MNCRAVVSSGAAILCLCMARDGVAQDDSIVRLAVLVPEQVMAIVFRETTARWPTPSQRSAVRSPEVTSPRKIKDVPPIYPTAARVAGVSGTVIVQIVIDEIGKVRSATIVRSITLLDQAAIDCVMQWQYMPALSNGRPIPSTMVVTVTIGPSR